VLRTTAAAPLTDVRRRLLRYVATTVGARDHVVQLPAVVIIVQLLLNQAYRQEVLFLISRFNGQQV